MRVMRPDDKGEEEGAKRGQRGSSDDDGERGEEEGRRNVMRGRVGGIRYDGEVRGGE